MYIAKNPLHAPSANHLIRAAIGLTIVSLVLCGFAYSVIATGLGQAIFPHQANGSMITVNDKIYGSHLVAQPFVQNKYFHPRPSASNYDPMAMAGSNLARTNPTLQQTVDDRLNRISIQEKIDISKIPADLATTSGSGIDPDISIQSAIIQIKRIAQARQIPEEEIFSLIQKHSVQPTFFILGKARVNVLELNISMDRLH